MAHRMFKDSKACSLRALRFALDPQDNVKKAFRWLLYGKIDAKHFKKVLPHTYFDDFVLSGIYYFLKLNPRVLFGGCP